MNDIIIRRESKSVKVKDMIIGGRSQVSIQSMTNTDTHDIDATTKQILALQNAGCDIVRITLPDLEAVSTVRLLKANPDIQIPIVGDIHFDYKIALAAAEAGIDKIRINPGNIGADERVKAVADACKKRNIPIRIGVNSGSLEKHILQKHGSPTPDALCESALYHASLLEKFDFNDIVISVKASNPLSTIHSYRKLASMCEYPLHLGVTEAGGAEAGAIKSAVGIGTLLAEGIGDTIRVSLTADPVKEIYAAKAILSSLDLDVKKGLEIVSCPTCGRTKIDLISLLEQFERAVDENSLRSVSAKVALMGCIVNGPGEAREADIGIAGGIGEAVFFKQGKIIEKIPESKVIPKLIEELKKLSTRDI